MVTPAGTAEPKIHLLDQVSWAVPAASIHRQAIREKQQQLQNLL
ncbi:hypothetical protein [Halobacillus sp. H74]